MGYPKQVHIGYKDNGSTEVYADVNSPEEHAAALGVAVEEIPVEEEDDLPLDKEEEQ